MKGDEASFVLGVDISSVLQQILRHLQVVVASCGEGKEPEHKPLFNQVVSITVSIIFTQM